MPFGGITGAAGSVHIEINAKDNSSKVVKKVRTEFKEFGKIVAGSVTGFLSAQGAISALQSAVSGLQAVVVSSMQAFREHEVAAIKFNSAIDNLGGSVQAEIPVLREWIRELEYSLAISDEQSRSLFAMAVNYGYNSKEAREAVEASIALSHAYDIELSEALKKVAEATNGNVQAFAELMPQIKGLSEQEALVIVMENIGNAMEGAGEDAQTATKRIKRLNDEWKDFQASGMSILSNTGFTKRIEGLAAKLEFANKSVAYWQPILAPQLSRMGSGGEAEPNTPDVEGDVLFGGSGKSSFGFNTVLDPLKGIQEELRRSVSVSGMKHQMGVFGGKGRTKQSEIFGSLAGSANLRAEQQQWMNDAMGSVFASLGNLAAPIPQPVGPSMYGASAFESRALVGRGETQTIEEQTVEKVEKTNNLLESAVELFETANGLLETIAGKDPLGEVVSTNEL